MSNAERVRAWKFAISTLTSCIVCQTILIMSSTHDKIEGNAHKAKGNVKEAVGHAIGNEKMEAEGTSHVNRDTPHADMHARLLFSFAQARLNTLKEKSSTRSGRSKPSWASERMRATRLIPVK